MGIKTLWDISTWEIENPNRWTGWSLPDCLEDLINDKILLFNHLSGIATVAKQRRDRRGWRSCSGSYSAAEGYLKFVNVPNVPCNPAIWKQIWECKTLPKIDMFI